jgi:hypothetical protein
MRTSCESLIKHHHSSRDSDLGNARRTDTPILRNSDESAGRPGSPELSFLYGALRRAEPKLGAALWIPGFPGSVTCHCSKASRRLDSSFVDPYANQAGSAFEQTTQQLRKVVYTHR